MTRLPIKSPLSTLVVAAWLAAVLAWPLSCLGFDPDDVATFVATAFCPNCDLSGALLDEIVEGDGDFSNANLANANLYRTDFDQLNLSGADLSGANMVRASFMGADLTGALLDSADTTDTLTNEFTICPDGTAGPCDF